MVHTISTRTPDADAQSVNLSFDHAARAGLDGAHARSEIARSPGGINMAYEAVMRHAKGALAETVALRWLGEGGATATYSYAELGREVARFASLLDELGVGTGETVCSFAGRLPHLHVAALGTLAHRSLFCPLSAALGTEAILAQIGLSRAKLVVTTERLYTRRLAALRDRLPDLEHVFLLDLDLDHEPPAGTRSLVAALQNMSDAYTISPTAPEDPALLHFTSGTTGEPKGVLHGHEAVVSQHLVGRVALDLRAGDVYWCTAEPGSILATAYGIIAPLTHGVTLVIDEAEGDPQRWYEILAEQQVTVWCTAPSAIRALMRAGVGLARDFDLSTLRFIASVGEPLDPEALRWSVKALDLPVHDNWWQTETGGIMVANHASITAVSGSMGKPLPGLEVAIVARVAGGVQVIEAPDVPGELAVRMPWPSMFRDYLDQPDHYDSCFVDGWYLSGDLASRDADGYLWYVGRTGDMIESAGQVIGPSQIETAMLEHPAVAEAAVIGKPGKPDETAGAIIKIFVALAPGFAARDALRRELLGFGRARLGPTLAPREIEFSKELPKTCSGKLMRRLLEARELGLPEGDTSTLGSAGDG